MYQGVRMKTFCSSERLSLKLDCYYSFLTVLSNKSYRMKQHTHTYIPILLSGSTFFSEEIKCCRLAYQ